VQTEFHRSTRIVAPVPLVWEEMATLDAILAKSPQFLSYQLAPGGESAQVSANLSWGPLKYPLEGTAQVQGVEPHRQTTYVFAAPSIGLHYAGTLHIAPGGAAETALEYSGELEIEHRMAARMRGLFSEVIEDHIHGLTSRVKTRAEHRRLAEERLLK
jgi:hypothetical protein